MSELIVSVSGLRGIVGETLTEQVAACYATAFAESLPAGPILVTRDGRASGPQLSDAICGALCKNNRNIFDGAVAATPTTGVLVRHLKCAGAIQISASHNPAEYNGMKLFGANGRVISAAQGQLVKQRFDQLDNLPLNHLSSTSDPKSITMNDTHRDLVLATVNSERIRQARFKVLLDSNHGAGSSLGVSLLQELGCDVTVKGKIADGQFEHLPEPTATNLQGICRQVSDCDAVVGFCQDPDADRLAVVDENGQYIGEEYTLALCVDHVLRQNRGPIVTNCSTSRMSQDIAQRHGVMCYRSKVGEAHVCDEMVARQAVFGGEGNGGPIDPRVGYVRDSFVGMALILDAMAEQNQSVSDLVKNLPKYFIQKTTLAIDPRQIQALFDKLELVFCVADSSRLDGLRLDWPDQWLLVRASNTEPIVRVIAEASSLQAVQKLCNLTRQVVES